MLELVYERIILEFMISLQNCLSEEELKTLEENMKAVDDSQKKIVVLQAFMKEIHFEDREDFALELQKNIQFALDEMASTISD